MITIREETNDVLWCMVKNFDASIVIRRISLINLGLIMHKNYHKFVKKFLKMFNYTSI